VDKSYFVYILASKPHGTLYTGITSDLLGRVWQHKHDAVEGFTKKYRVHQLVWYEHGDSIEHAIQREKQLKKWNRAWKLELIEKFNPMWDDLYDRLTDSEETRIVGSGSPRSRG
jgi:putative endonuclease